MSLETRSSSALFKRAEQLKRWEESETNREVTASNSKTRKIQFSAGCVFLAACAAGDKEEVLRLIGKGADIDTANVDGLTALHQACIDDDLDMVEFLVEHGGDVNRGDNEGWTPLHATASCGFVSIARYLIEHGANVAAVNNDAELPVDIADSDEMEDMLQTIITAQGINADEARNEEERLMLADAKEWLNSGERRDLPHPKTGATALHVAAAKGYIKVISTLLQGKYGTNTQDFDGWTPLHAAAHWGQREACELLVENFCDMEMKNFVGQTAFDVADTEMVRTLEELKKKQAMLQQDHADVNAILPKSGANTQKRRISNADKSNLINKDASAERQLRDRTISEESSNKVKKVELEIKAESDKDDASREEENEVEKKNRVNRDEPLRIPTVPTEVNKTVPYPAPSSPPKTPSEADDGVLPSWRRPGSVRLRGQDEPPNKLRIGEKDNSSATSPTTTAATTTTTTIVATTTTTNTATTTTPKTNAIDSNEVALRRTHSFESDEKRGIKEEPKEELAATMTTSVLTTTTATPTVSVTMSPSKLTATSPTATPTVSVTMSPTKLTATSPTATSPLPTSQVRSPGKDTEPSVSAPQTPTTPTTPGGSKLSPGNIFKNFFKSFVPPVRDEESETQRKAHAKRVRETRRSTQGVTLEEIKSAEQLVKKKNQQQLTQATQQLNNDQPAVTVPTTNTASITATITTAAPTIVSADVATKASDQVIPSQERRPSWRLRVDNGDKSKFLLEDARNRNSTAGDTTTAYVRRTSTTNPRPSSAPVESSTIEASATLALRRNTRPPDDDKEQDKENDSRTAQATQAVIQRRRRPKRRSTGVVHVDMDEIDPDRQDVLARGDSEEVTKLNNDESGGDWSGRSSRLNSVSSTGDSAPNSRGATPAHTKEASENGELDYKKLYEESLVVNERLRETLKKTDKDLTEAKSQIAKTSEITKGSLSEMEKRERRAMERKLSEMEEELKQLQKLKAENERLKAENRALTRVVSKLTNSANATK